MPSGYGSQTEIFAPRIRDLGHDVAISAFFGLAGKAMDWDGMRVYPSDNEYGNRWVGPCAAHHADTGDPRDVLILTLLDVWVLTGPLWPQLKVGSWCPVDHKPCPPRVTEYFTRTGAVPIAMSRFGEHELRNAGLDPLYVPHGVDTKQLGHRPDARRAFELPEDAFVVGMVAANQGATPPRKAFPQVFEAFAELRRRHSDALLYLHTVKTAGQTGLDLLALADVTGVPLDSIRWTPEWELYMGVEYPKMAYVYSAMDVLASPSYGEGFGIPIMEAQASGTPVIVNDFSAMPELVGAGWKTTGQRWYDATQGAWFSAPNTASVFEAMEDAYQSKSSTVADDRRATALAFAAGYDADHVTETYWRPALEQIRFRLHEAEQMPAVTFKKPNRRARRARPAKR